MSKVETTPAVPTVVDEETLKVPDVDEKDALSIEVDSTDSLNLDTAGENIKELRVNNKGAHISYNITDASDTHLYYLDSSHFTPGTPDMTLHAGVDKTAPVLAASRLHWLKRTVDVALGDPSSSSPFSARRKDEEVKGSEKGTQYGVMTRKGWFVGATNTWSMPGEEDSGKSYVWKRTRATTPQLAGAENVNMSKASLGHLKLIEAASGRTVACFVTTVLTWKNVGNFYIDMSEAPPGRENDWEYMVIMTCMAIKEKRKREVMYSAGSGSGGGGGGGGG